MLAYLAQAGHLSTLLDQIESQANARPSVRTRLRASVLGIHGNLVLVRFDREGWAASSEVPDDMVHPLHAAVTWFHPRVAPFKSISNAAEVLRAGVRAGGEASRGTKFSCYAAAEVPLHRKASLILDQLPRSRIAQEERHAFPLTLPLPNTPTTISQRRQLASSPDDLPAALLAPEELPPAAPMPPLAAFTLLNSTHLLYATRTSSPLPNGSVHFLWDRTNPPSRAYLKLWEALTRVQVEVLCPRWGLARAHAEWERIRPQTGSVVLDLGSAPGGWTWAAAQMGATVVSVDRAELALSVARLPLVHHFIGSGFSVDPGAEMLAPFLRRKARWLHRQKVKAAKAAARAAALDGELDAEEDEYAAQEADWAAAEADADDPLPASDPNSPSPPISEPAASPPAGSPVPDAAAVSSSSPGAGAGSGSGPRTRIDWLLSDIVCYPERALSLVQKWLAADAVQCGIIVTLKLQADGAQADDQLDSAGPGPGAPPAPKGPVQLYHLQQQEDILQQLRNIPNGRLVHLEENKNEVTFIWVRQ